MTQQIIDTDELDKLPKYWSSVHKCYMVMAEDVRALIANSPQADDMVLVPIEPTNEMIQAACDCQDHDPEDGYESEVYYCYKAMLSAYKPQVDDVPPDVYDIVVDTGDGIYHTAEVVHFQKSGSKRMIQVRLGDTQADDVRKDAERYRWIRSNPKLDICGTDEILDFDAMIDRAMDKVGRR